MPETFSEILTVGGKSNSLGRAEEVIDIVLHDKSRLEELYQCVFDEDAWVRMRAADSLEKVCRVYSSWLEPYIQRFEKELASSNQPSIQWHLAQMYAQVRLTDSQQTFAIKWLKKLVSTIEVDWIVAANAMETLAQFARNGKIRHEELILILRIQLGHKSKAVVKRANKLLEEYQ